MTLWPAARPVHDVWSRLDHPISSATSCRVCPTKPRCENALKRVPTPESLIKEAEEALVHGDAAHVHKACRTILKQLDQATAPAQVAGTALRLSARAHLLLGDGDAAIDVLTLALSVAEACCDDAAAVFALNHRANVHFRRGELDDAEQIYTAVRARARTAGERRIVALSTLNLGNIAYIRDDFPRALSYYQRALTDSRALNMWGDVALALSNIGLIHSGTARWDDAEAVQLEAIGILRETGDLDALARAYGNLAEMWVGKGDLERARTACTEAMTVCALMAHSGALGETYRVTGMVSREAGKLDEAEHHFAAAERVAIERNDLLLLAETAREQADLYRRRSRNRDTLQALNRAHRLFEQFRARRELADIGRRMARLETDFVAVARRWGESIEAADHYTQGHCQRVADLSCLIAEQAGLDAQALFWFRIGALLHDVGKIVIPADVLNKPGKLTDAEFALIRSHPTEGVRILADVEFPWDVRPIVESHHERWDGKGYPHGLAGEAIPLTARILCVADVYDALTSVRSYKRALAHDEAVSIMRRDVGAMFDPQVFAWFEAVAPAWAERVAAAPSADPAVRDARAEREALGLDGLTGLPRRAAFYEECTRVLAARASDGRPTSLLLVRITNFAALTAARGGGAGEAAIAAVADALSRNTRGGDFVGRYADDEFVVLLPDVPLAEAYPVAVRLEEVGEAARPAGAGEPFVAPCVAVGAAAVPPAVASPDQLLAAADTALRRAVQRVVYAPTARAA